MRSASIALLMLCLVMLVPRPARAQAYFVPSVGWDFGGDAGDCPALLSDCSVKRTTYGVSAGAISGGVIGLEVDFSYAPDFFGQSPAFDTNSVLTLMGNLLLSLPAGPVRPYVTGGIGLVRTRVSLTAGSLFSLDDSGFGYNLGGGLMLLFPHHLGVRGDLRRVRSTSDISLLGIGLPGSKLQFSRFSVGLVLH
jgi:hypothetical protein